MNRFQRFGIIGAAAAVLAAPAFACSIMPPPPPPMPATGTPQADVDALSAAWSKAHGLKYAGELRDWAMRRQVGLFDEAKRLVIVRHDRQAKAGDETVAVLRPVRWLRGSGASSELTIAMTQPPPCGQMIGHDAYYGRPGDVFLVYLSGDSLSGPDVSGSGLRQQDVLEAFSLDRIVEPRTITALTTP